MQIDYESVFEKFKNRDATAKETFDIYEIAKERAYEFVRQYHYLGDAKFFAMYSYGLFIKDTNILVGCATYSPVQGPNTLRGWFGISDNLNSNILELSRLCMLPTLNGSNATSYLLSNSMKRLKQHKIRAIITLADASRHIGSIYQVCNFKYYGLTDHKFEFVTVDRGKVKINSRINPGGTHGVWINKSQKHRYAFIFDKSLHCLHSEQPYPKNKGEIISFSCCNDTLVVYDNRFDEYYTCPKCTTFCQITKQEYDDVLKYGKEHTLDELYTYVTTIVNSHRSVDYDDITKNQLW